MLSLVKDGFRPVNYSQVLALRAELDTVKVSVGEKFANEMLWLELLESLPDSAFEK